MDVCGSHMCVPSAFPPPTKKPYEKQWWGYSLARNMEQQQTLTKRASSSTVSCEYCVAAVSEHVELLYLPLSEYNEIVYPTQDLGYSTDRSRTILKIPPMMRTSNDMSYFTHAVMKPHAFFQQMPVGARREIARALTIGFVEEGSILVDLEEVSGACFILLSGSAKIMAEWDGALESSQRSYKGFNPNRGSALEMDPEASPIVSNQRIIDAKVLEKLDPGDIFGTEMMMQDTASQVLVKVTEPSEFVVIPAAVYRNALGENDCLKTGKDMTTRSLSALLSSTSLRHITRDSEYSKLRSFDMFKQVPVCLLEKLGQAITLREYPTRSALGMSGRLFTIILKGSASLHLINSKRQMKMARENREMMEDAQLGRKKNTVVSLVTRDGDIENREVRNWWKRRGVEEAHEVVEAGVLLGGFVDKQNFSDRAFAFTRTRTLVCEIDRERMADWRSGEGDGRKLACEMVSPHTRTAPIRAFWAARSERTKLRRPSENRQRDRLKVTGVPATARQLRRQGRSASETCLARPAQSDGRPGDRSQSTLTHTLTPPPP